MTALLPSGVKVHLALSYIDMRKGLDGLAMLVQGVLRQDPFSGHLFVFRGKRGGLSEEDLNWALTEGAVVPKEAIHSIRVLERFSFVEVSADQAERADRVLELGQRVVPAIRHQVQVRVEVVDHAPEAEQREHPQLSSGVRRLRVGRVWAPGIGRWHRGGGAGRLGGERLLHGAHRGGLLGGLQGA